MFKNVLFDRKNKKLIEDKIYYRSAIEFLYSNNIQKLPETINNLDSLELLDVSTNNLSSLTRWEIYSEHKSRFHHIL